MAEFYVNRIFLPAHFCKSDKNKTSVKLELIRLKRKAPSEDGGLNLNAAGCQYVIVRPALMKRGNPKNTSAASALWGLTISPLILYALY
jgi:hypothetical protein